nr:MAG TPA: tail tube protein [Caudoviricetes sp.]
MATAGVSTLGITLSYGVETSAGTKPTAFTLLTRINEIGEVSVETEAIDASALEDKQTRNIPGRDTVSETMTVTVNKTDETIAEWEKVISDYAALSGGKRMWFQTITPGFTKAEFVVAAPPSKLPISAKSQNELQTMEINLTVDEMVGSDTKVTPTSGE